MGFEFLIIALLVSRYLVRNYWQDGIAAWRGEDPPSFRREQERLKAKQARGEGPDTHRAAKRYFANAWNDAFETAEEQRARRRAKRLKGRHEKWAAEDLGAGGGGGPEGAEETRPATEPDQRDGLCWYCEKEAATTHCNNNAGMIRPACAGCAAARGQRPDESAPNPEPFPEAPAPNDTCWYCGSPATTTSLNDTGDLQPACAACKDRRENKGRPDPADMPVDGDNTADDPNRPEVDADQPYEVVDAAPDNPSPGGKVIQFPTMNTITKEEHMSAEIVGLRAAVSWTAESAQKSLEAVSEVELAIAGLTGGGTTGSAITDLQGAQEYHSLAAAKYQASHEELVRQLAVAEAYEANKGAGTKQFVTNN